MDCVVGTEIIQNTETVGKEGDGSALGETLWSFLEDRASNALILETKRQT